MKIKLFCIPFTGGSFISYRSFMEKITDFIDMISVEYPGCGSRIRESLLEDINEIVEDAWNQIYNELDNTYTIYGHSMVALVSFLLIKKIIKHNINSPIHFFAFGFLGTSIDRKNKDIYLFPKNLFIEKLNEYGGMPEEILAKEELMDFLSPILKADFQAVASYEHQKSALCNIPFTAMM